MFRAGGNEVDPGGLDGAVTQDVRKLCDVAGDAVEHPGEQMTQIVGVDLSRVYPRFFAHGLHLRPDLPAGQGLAFGREEQRPGGDLLLSGVFEKLPAQLAGEHDDPDLPLEGDLRPALPRRLHGDILNLADPDAGGADGLH